MKFISNCHTHTTFCDGKSSAEESVNKAIELGFVSLGFSGHSPLPYENGYAMSRESMPMYINEIRQLQAKYKDRLEIACGIEWDKDTTTDFPFSLFDYRLGAVHQLHGDKIYPVDKSADCSRECIENVFGGNFYAFAEKYYSQVYETALQEQVNVLAHFDLIAKFNSTAHLFDETDKKYRDIALSVLDGIVDKRPELIFEVNTGAMNRAKKEWPYPADFLMKRLAQRGVRLTLTSDCHKADSLTFGFEKAVQVMQQCNVKSLYIIRSTGFEEIPLY